MATTSQYTLAKWISQFRDERFILPNYTFSSVMSDGTNAIVFPEETMLTTYAEELETYKTSAVMTDREQNFYRYQPRMFAYDLYGYPEMWYLILYANEIVSALEFDFTTVYFYTQSVTTLLNAIISLESDRKDDNEQEITDLTTSGEEVNNDVRISVSDLY